MCAEHASPYPQMKATASRGGDRHSGDDSFHEATSSRRSSSRDQLSDVSAPAACLLSCTFPSLSGAPHLQQTLQAACSGRRGSHEGFAFAISILPSLKHDFSLIRTSPLGGV